MKATELYKNEILRISKENREKRMELIIKERDCEINYLKQRSAIRDKRSSEYAKYKVACSIADQHAIDAHMKKLNEIEDEELFLKSEYKAQQRMFEIERSELHSNLITDQIIAKQKFKSMSGQEIENPSDELN